MKIKIAVSVPGPKPAPASNGMVWKNRLTKMTPLAVRMVKESMNRGQDIPNIADASLVDAYRFMVLEMSEDKTEAHEAWRERRKPRFRGR